MQNTKKRILVLGASGMLGHVVSIYLSSQSNKYEVINAVYKTKLTLNDFVCDVSNKTKVLELLIAVKPAIIVNCVGALINQSKESPAEAIWLNAYFPHYLSSIVSEEVKIIHISTDCVFSGNQGGYHEKAIRDAEDIYGRSKSLGELLEYRLHCTLRTSIIGPEIKKNGTGLFHWLLQQRGSIKGYSHAFWGGVTTFQLSKAIEDAIDTNLVGLYHVSNGQKISKFDLLNLIKDEFCLKDIIINEAYVQNVDKSLMSSLSYDFKVPNYAVMISEMRNMILSRPMLYKAKYPQLF